MTLPKTRCSPKDGWQSFTHKTRARYTASKWNHIVAPLLQRDSAATVVSPGRSTDDTSMDPPPIRFFWQPIEVTLSLNNLAEMRFLTRNVGTKVGGFCCADGFEGHGGASFDARDGESSEVSLVSSMRVWSVKNPNVHPSRDENNNCCKQHRFETNYLNDTTQRTRHQTRTLVQEACTLLLLSSINSS